MTPNLSGSKSRDKNTQAHRKLGQGAAINMGDSTAPVASHSLTDETLSQL